MVRGIKGNTERKTFLYSVSYPKCDGKSITHDPAYSAVAAVTTETADGDGGGVPGFEFAIVFFTIPILVLIEAYRRKSR